MYVYLRQTADELPSELRSHSGSAAEYLQHVVLSHRALKMTIGPHLHIYPDGRHIWDRNGHPDYVPLSSELLQAICGDGVQRTIKTMIGAGMIERTDHYGRDAHCYGYRIGPALAGLRTRRVCMRDRGIRRRIDRQRRRDRSGWKRVHHYLDGWLSQIDINAAAAAAEADEEHRRVIMDTIQQHEHDATVCPYGRFHSVYTRMARAMREHLHYRGSRLVSTDIANSQPLFLGVAMIRDMKDEAPADVREYVGLCESGSLYQTLMTESGWTGTKSEWKSSMWFRFLYGSAKSLERYEIEPDLKPLLPLMQVFGRRFPHVLEWMTAQKSSNYRRLPCRMQKVESQMIIRRVCGLLMRRHPGIPVVTIHDSILTTPENIEIVESLINDEFGKSGFRPCLSRA